jgi:uncharacterized protein YllA (UPF0747 family)
MRLDINKNWAITTDQYNYTLNKRMIKQTGESKGEEYLVQHAYYGSLQKALEGFLRHSPRLDEKTFTKINEAIDYMKGLVEELKNIEINLKSQLEDVVKGNAVKEEPKPKRTRRKKS